MGARWLSLPSRQGTYTRQAHADVPAGAYERELGREGFYGPSSQMLHRHPPTSWSEIEGPLRPRAFDTAAIDACGDTPWQAPLLFHNASVRLRLWHCVHNMSCLARNADGDELLFVHKGSGSLFCDYGHLAIREGDYVLLPRGTLWRIEVHEPLRLLLIEATNDAYRLPEKGLVGHHAIFDPAVLDIPAMDDAFLAQQGEDPWEVQIKRHDAISRIRYAYNPLDALGWHGDLTPVRLNWRDIRPLMSHRYHVPPSAHTTFLARRFVICTFCPRPMETDPGALKVPFFHNNDDYDELIFYHRGAFFSRDNIHPGMFTLHPGGITHGPHPKALRAGQQPQREATDEVAVMLDTRDALTVGTAAETVEAPDYANSWREETP